MSTSSSSVSSEKRMKIDAPTAYVTPQVEDEEMEDSEEEEEDMVEDGLSDDGWELNSTDKAIKQANTAAMLDGSLSVHREAFMGVLTVADIETVLRRPFRSPCLDSRTEESDKLLKTKSLGLRRPFSTIDPKFQRPREGAKAPEEVDEVTEPCILWQPPADSMCDPVQVKPPLLKFLREHQREGVKFVFECVAGLRTFGGNGCILADDMGLGKTLQSITLIWTLLKQGFDGKPMAKKIIVVCPTSLVKNWENEVKKWLGPRVVVKALNESTKDKVTSGIKQFTSNIASLRTDVLVISYDTFRLHASKFNNPGSCDLLICDEAHRLKNDQTATNKSLNDLACRRRVLLSGTPMQNDLGEFYAMVNFANPGVLGDQASFNKKWATPILAGREPDATESEKKRGEECSKELSNLVNQFILRRTNKILSAHLPPKITQLVCVGFTDIQRSLYNNFCRIVNRSLADAEKRKQGGAVRVLSSIISLRKLCNHPKLVYDLIASNNKEAEGWEQLRDLFPDDFVDSRDKRAGGGGFGDKVHANLSGKFALIEALLIRLKRHTRDRIVIVSNFTQTLDIFGKLCSKHSWPVLRLDGGTSVKKRQQLVDRLNDPLDDQFVFLLSSKAGGCGLNMIGANRLVLFDPDWNPATDKQAMARVWRDGQKKQVYIYRFFCTGSIEEKIYQRQLSKEGLQTIVVDEKEEVNSLSTNDLRNLFSILGDTASDTLDMLRKKYVRRADVPKLKGKAKKEAQAAAAAAMNEDEAGEGAPAEAMMDSPALECEKPTYQAQIGFPAEEDLRHWGHHPDPLTVPDEMLKRAYEDVGLVSFVFSCHVQGKEIQRY